MRISFSIMCSANSGFSARNWRNCTPGTTQQVVASRAFTETERLSPSSESSPRYSPGPCSASTTSRPLSELAYTRSNRPLSTM